VGRDQYQWTQFHHLSVVVVSAIVAEKSSNVDSLRRSIMRVAELYVARSRACPSIQYGFYVFENHIVYKTEKGVFAVSYADLQQEGKYANPVDGYRAWEPGFQKPPYVFLGDLSNKDLRKLRKRIRLRCRT